MNTILIVLQVIVAAGLLNVWLLRFNRATPYRGGNSKSLKDEFTSYGLPAWFSYFIGVLKVCSAILLILGIWNFQVIFPTALLVTCLMVGAILMHFKIRDPLIKSLPAFMMLIFVVGIMLISKSVEIGL